MWSGCDIFLSNRPSFELLIPATYHRLNHTCVLGFLSTASSRLFWKSNSNQKKMEIDGFAFVTGGGRPIALTFSCFNTADFF